MVSYVAHSSDDEIEEMEEYIPEPPERAEKSLLRSLRGVDLRRLFKALIVTMSYGTSPKGALRPFGDDDRLSGDRDRKAMRRLLECGGYKEIELVSNEAATRNGILAAGRRLSSTGVAFLQGHADCRQFTNPPVIDSNAYNPNVVYDGIEYRTYDCYMDDPPRGLTCSDLYHMFLPSLDSDREPTRRLVLTDFCFGYNFNRLRYTLKIIPGSPPCWIECPGWITDTRRPETDILVHFAASASDQQAYESNPGGGFFTQGFCKFMTRPMTLPNLLNAVRIDVEKSTRNAMRLNGLGGMQQVPEIYSSHCLDLKDANTMKMFGFF